ncbi:phage protein NinX family protein [Burkholderia gladioli]|uniref:phage protein NinX family protein n=1 Tax=Burkholderia gladioli TaxID=28095 RepID=UPI00163ED6AE|nr:phage protein NinX family protein [Burkholderia gladioli]
MKVSELRGARLDMWVARAEGFEPFYPPEHTEHLLWIRDNRSARKCPAYSDDWAAGGPIIEKANIGVLPVLFDSAGNAEGYRAVMLSADRGIDGYSHLAAAMRAYVASVYGAEVPDSPDAAPPAEVARLAWNGCRRYMTEVREQLAAHPPTLSRVIAAGRHALLADAFTTVEGWNLLLADIRASGGHAELALLQDEINAYTILLEQAARAKVGQPDV